MVKHNITVSIDLDTILSAKKAGINVSKAAEEGIAASLPSKEEAGNAYENAWKESEKLLTQQGIQDYQVELKEKEKKFEEQDRKTWNKTYAILKAEGKLPPFKDYYKRLEKRILLFQEMKKKEEEAECTGDTKED